MEQDFIPGQKSRFCSNINVNYGYTLANYSLNSISDEELDLKKLEYADDGMSLDRFYETDPIEFLKYNIIDVVLTVRLNDKLKHIELHNMLRRDMKTPFTSSLIGVSTLFTSMFRYEIQKENSGIRWGVLQEVSNSVSEVELQNIEKPKENKMKWNLQEIDERTFKRVLSRFPGAYVKEGLGKLLTIKDGLLVSMDASSLYPSMMLRNNISFDTYYGRVIDPVCHNFIKFLKAHMGQNKRMSSSLKTQVFGNIKKAVDRISPQNKNNYKQYLYFMFMSLLNKVMSTNKTFDEVTKPSSISDMLLLKGQLIQLLDLVVEINKEPEYHTFAYEYIINHVDETGSPIYVIQNENEPSCRIVNLPDGSFGKFLKDNQLSFNLSGALFYRSDYKLGLLNHFLNERLAMRKRYRDQRDQFEPGTYEHQFYDRNQLSCKVNINSSYGLTGMSTFQFSNKQLAASITLSGRLALKCSQAIGELYLKSIE